MNKTSRLIIATFFCLSMSSCNTWTGLIGDIFLGNDPFDPHSFTMQGMDYEAEKEKRTNENQSDAISLREECIRERDMEDILLMKKYQQAIARKQTFKRTEGYVEPTGNDTIHASRERFILAFTRRSSKLMSDSLLRFIGDTLVPRPIVEGQNLPKIFITKKLEDRWVKAEVQKMMSKSKEYGYTYSEEDVKVKALAKVRVYSNTMSEEMEAALRKEMRLRMQKKNKSLPINKKIPYTNLSEAVEKWDPSFVSEYMKTILQ